MSDNKRIAKNTLFLYFRMILIMGVTLYTSRVILDKLGLVDFGLYQVVGGVVGMLSFLNSTLSTGTSRFLTFELGTGDRKKLRQTFSTAFYTHTLLGIIVVILLESGGLWFLYNKLVIPPERLSACFWVFQLSILTTFVGITQVPYTSSIMSHECMGVYAYISIYEAIAKLVICYLLSLTPIDRLIFYAILIAIVQLSVTLFYRIYCKRNFEECGLSLIFNKSILKKMMGFSGWNIMANISNMLGHQGTIILINMFFSPVVVAAQAIAGQVSNSILQFVNNFRTAINPQVIKLYAAGEKTESKRLTLETTVFCFDLLLMLGLPAIITMDTIMHVWLVEVPDYAIAFTQWLVIRQIIGVFSASFYTPILAANKMKINSIAAVVLGIGEFVLLYLFLSIGFGPMWIQYLGCVVAIGFSMVVKPYVLIKQIDYSAKEILTCYWICFKTLLFATVFSLIPAYILGEGILMSIIKAMLVGVIVVISSYVFLAKQTRKKVNYYIRSKIHI